MIEAEEKLIKMLSRIKKSPDGPELIEYLEELSADNYRAFKNGPHDRDALCKGYAIAIDSLIKSFQNCDQEKEKDPLAEQAKSAWP